jgi:hypothetical protein
MMNLAFNISLQPTMYIFFNYDTIFVNNLSTIQE